MKVLLYTAMAVLFVYLVYLVLCPSLSDNPAPVVQNPVLIQPDSFVENSTLIDVRFYSRPWVYQFLMKTQTSTGSGYLLYTYKDKQTYINRYKFSTGLLEEYDRIQTPWGELQWCLHGLKIGWIPVVEKDKGKLLRVEDIVGFVEDNGMLR